MGKCDNLFPRNALLATTPPESQHMPKYVRGEVTKEAREELSRAAPTSASQCRRRHRAIPGAEFPEHVQLEPRRVPKFVIAMWRGVRPSQRMSTFRGPAARTARTMWYTS